MAQFKNYLEERAACDIFTYRQMKEFEKFVDRIFKKFNIDFEFTRHFVDRLGDSRNKPCITAKDLAQFIQKIYKKGGKSLTSVKDIELVLKDMQSDLNMPVAVEYDAKNDEFDVIAKTIMRKKNFKTPNKVIRYEEKEE